MKPIKFVTLSLLVLSVFLNAKTSYAQDFIERSATFAELEQGLAVELEQSIFSDVTGLNHARAILEREKILQELKDAQKLYKELLTKYSKGNISSGEFESFKTKMMTFGIASYLIRDGSSPIKFEHEAKLDAKARIIGETLANKYILTETPEKLFSDPNISEVVNYALSNLIECYQSKELAMKNFKLVNIGSIKTAVTVAFLNTLFKANQHVNEKEALQLLSDLYHHKGSFNQFYKKLAIALDFKHYNVNMNKLVTDEMRFVLGEIATQRILRIDIDLEEHQRLRAERSATQSRRGFDAHLVVKGRAVHISRLISTLKY